ncbi:dihydrolipoamide acetyltransferase family protein [Nannocystaceae bacterium ST9]
MSEFRMPSLGADMDTGSLVEWLIEPGDVVTRGQIVAVVETQKGAIDIEIFDEGEIVELLVHPIAEVPVGTVLAIYHKPGEVLEPHAAAESPVLPPPAAIAASEAAPARSSTPASTPASSPALSTAAIRIAPRARKLAEQFGIDLHALIGTGPEGSITGADVEAAMRAQPEPARTPLTNVAGMRQAIAASMSRSKREIPHYYLFHTIDFEPALTWLEARNDARPIAERLLPVVLLVRALALALRRHRELCGFWREGAFVASEGLHVGLAVALREGGLINPAIHDAERGSLEQLMKRIRDTSQRARNGGLRASELSDAAITLTSLGERGVDGVLGVIQPPQVAIVGVGAIRRRPWVVGDQVVPRRLIEVGLSADHRVSDGHAGARFLIELERLLLAPESLQ